MLPGHQLGVGDLDLALVAIPVDIDPPIKVRNDGLTFRGAGFEQLLDAGQTLCDVFTAGHSARVERS